MKTSRSLMLEKRFSPLFWTQFFGAFNDNFLKNALIGLITFRSVQVLGIPSAEMVSVSGGIFILPFFLFSATAGQLADKMEKGRMIRIIKLVEIGIMFLAAVGFLSARYELLLAVLFLMGLHSTFFGPIKYSILPQLLHEDELVEGNGLIEAGTFLSILFGTIAGGQLASIEGAGLAMVSMGLIACAAVGYLASRAIPLANPVDPSIRIQWNPVTPTIQIVRFAASNRTVFLSILGISWFWFLGGAILALLPPYCRDVLHGGQSLLTFFLALFSIGIAIGSVLCGKLSRERLELGLVPFGSIGLTLFSLDLYLRGAPAFVSQTGGTLSVAAFLAAPQGLRIAADLLLLAIFSGFFIVPLFTLVQERSEPSQRSRILAGNNILNALFMVASALFLPALMNLHLGIPQIFLILALLNGAVATYIYLLLPEFLIRFMIWLLACCLYRLRVEGAEAIPEEGPALLVCNHVSFIDWMIIAAGIKRPVRFVMDHQFFRGFLLKRILTRAKVIPIAPAKEDPALLERAYDRIAEELRQGELVCIFPEGKITRDGKLSEFKPGVLKVIERTPIPVVPMALSGLWGSFFSRKSGKAMRGLPRKLWHRITLRVGAPVSGAEIELSALSSTLALSERGAIRAPFGKGFKQREPRRRAKRSVGER